MFSTRRAASGFAVLLCLGGCANLSEQAGSVPSSAAPSSSSAAPTAEPRAAQPTATGVQTITGTVEAGVEPNCLLLQDASGSHMLVFDDASMRADAVVGTRVTLTGRSDPTMMTTCQQGIPFIVTSVTPA